MTSRDDLLAVAKTQLLRLATDEQWSTNEDLRFLVPAHHILGIALGYDWLYGALTPSERASVRERLGREADTQHRRITQERVWWRNQYFQNHSHSNTAALAFAAAALWGEDERAAAWLATAERFFEKTFSRGTCSTRTSATVRGRVTSRSTWSRACCRGARLTSGR